MLWTQAHDHNGVTFLLIIMFPSQLLSSSCLSSLQCPVYHVILHNLCHLHVSPQHNALPTASSNTTSITSMSLITTTPCPLRSPPQPLSPQCLSSPRHPTHCILRHNLCHLHVSPHQDTLPTASSSTTSATSMSLLTKTPYQLHPPPQPLPPPCLSSPRHPTNCILLHNLCHLHVSPHQDTLPIASCDTTSATSMSLLTMTPYQLHPATQPLSPPCLSSPRHPTHCILRHNLCHLHVSPHQDTLPTASSDTTSVTSMSLLTMKPCPLHSATQPLSHPCLSSP